jgi:hypothetical protein
MGLMARSRKLSNLYRIALVSIPSFQISFQSQDSESLFIMPRIKARSTGYRNRMGAAVQNLQASHLPVS